MDFEEWWDKCMSWTEYEPDQYKKWMARAAWEVAWEAAMKQREAEITEIRAGIVKTLEDNLDLTDGDNCTLYELKKLVGWD